jgi:hypothetical protein
MTHRFTPSAGNETETREWETDEPSFTTGAVCLKCNNGWLSELETEASHLVGPLILGKPTSLTTEHQMLVALWSYKTVLLLQMMRAKEDRPIPTRRFREVFELGRPPADVRIWLGQPNGNNALHEGTTEINLANARHAVPGFFTALAIGRLLILCAGRLERGSEQLRIGRETDPQIAVEIWPASLRTRDWPPPESVTDLSLKTLAGRL